MTDLETHIELSEEFMAQMGMENCPEDWKTRLAMMSLAHTQSAISIQQGEMVNALSRLIELVEGRTRLGIQTIGPFKMEIDSAPGTATDISEHAVDGSLDLRSGGVFDLDPDAFISDFVGHGGERYGDDGELLTDDDVAPTDEKFVNLPHDAVGKMAWQIITRLYLDPTEDRLQVVSDYLQSINGLIFERDQNDPGDIGQWIEPE